MICLKGCERFRRLISIKQSHQVKKTVRMSEESCSLMAKKGFAVLIEAKEEDERKKAILHKFYKETEDCLNTMDEKGHAFLEADIGNLKDIFACHKRDLEKKGYILLVAGKRGIEKNTLLNLILGEQLLPCSVVGNSSTICELKYGTTPRLVAHLKDNDPETGLSTKTVFLGESVKTSQQSYLRQISFGNAESDGEKNYEKIELFWPHTLLKEGIVIVDISGVGDSAIMNDMVKAYLPEAFAFIYVINSVNAGGIQQDRVEKQIEHARQLCLDKQMEYSLTCPLFVCNKWDQVPPEEAGHLKNCVVKHLTECWPSVNPESHIIYMSSTNTSNTKYLRIITEEVDKLMNGIGSTALKSTEARLEIQWRWLYYLLSRMAYHTKATIRESSENHERMALVTKRLRIIEKQQYAEDKQLKEYLENETAKAVSALSKFLKSPEAIEQFTSWTLDHVPNTERSWEMTLDGIQKALMKRLQDVIAAWEENNHVFSDARTSLFQYLQQLLNHAEGQPQNLESSDIDEDAASPSSDPLTSENLSLTEKVVIGASSPIWVPVGLAVLLVSAPVISTMAAKEKLADWRKTREYEKDKCGFMANASREYLSEVVDEQNLKSLVVEEFKADKLMIHQLDVYKPVYKKSVHLIEKLASFGIDEIGTMDISCDDLEWKEDRSSLLGAGAFASVYRGTLKLQEEEQPVHVALKVWHKALNDCNTSRFLSETDTLRRLNHPLIVKLYGATLLKERGELRAILVMELCKENLMRHIFQNRSKIPGLSTTPAAARNVMRWAKDIASALEFIHNNGIVHRDLKLENILLSHEDVVKVADVGVSKEANMITGTVMGTPSYIAPEVILRRPYDYKADIYSFSLMLWEMWYGKRAFHDVEGDEREFYDQVVKGNRPAHVEDRMKPPTAWQDLMQRCWDEKADKRPDATACHMELTTLYQDPMSTN